MSLRLALLGLLEAKPMTGYELAKAFDVSLANTWYANHSQIYPELRRLEQDELVTACEVARGKRATKKRYEITEAGCAQLRAWAESVVVPERQRDEAMLKSTYLEWATYGQARRQFEAHLTESEQQRIKWLAHVEDLRNRDTDLMRARLAGADEAAAAAITAYKVHVIEGLIKRAEGEIAWARRGIELADELRAKAGAAADDRPVEPAPPIDQGAAG